MRNNFRVVGIFVVFVGIAGLNLNAGEVLKVSVPLKSFLNKRDTTAEGKRKNLTIPVVRAFSGKNGVQSFGYSLQDGIYYFCVKFTDKKRPQNITGIYVDADNDKSTGRKKVGNEYYLAPQKNIVRIYTGNKEKRIQFEICYFNNGILLMGVKKSDFSVLPLVSGKTVIRVATSKGKLPKIKL